MSEPTNKTTQKGKTYTFRQRTDSMSNKGFIVLGTPSVSSTTKNWTNSFSGRKNPSWKAQVKAVTDATTPADGSELTVEVHDPSYTYVGWTDRRAAEKNVAKLPNWWLYFRQARCSGVPFGLTSLQDVTDPGGSTTSADNLAIQRLYEKLTSFAQSAQTGEDIGEARQTLNAFRRPLPAIRNLVNNAIEGHAKALTKRPGYIARALADTHLEMVYGWNPLARSLADVIVGMQNRTEMAIYQPFNCSGKTTDSGSKINTSASGPSGILIRATGKRSGTSSVRYKGVWKTAVTVPERPVQDVLGLRSQNFLPTVWNLIPYSFLIDYFTNIGTIVSSLQVPWGGVQWCCKTTRRTYETYVSLVGEIDIGPNALFDFKSGTAGSIKATLKTYSRRSQSTLPFPSLEFTSLSEVSGRHWTNIAALITTRIPGLNKLVDKAVKKDPGLPQTFIREMAYRRPNKKEGISFTFG